MYFTGQFFVVSMKGQNAGTTVLKQKVCIRPLFPVPYSGQKLILRTYERINRCYFLLMHCVL